MAFAFREVLKMDRYYEIKQKLLALCETEQEIKAVILIGSQARDYCKADEYSDVDLIIAYSHPEKLLYEDTLIRKLGMPVYSFVEDSIAGERERRILFEGSLDVDMIILTDDRLKSHLNSRSINEIMNRGYKLLFDRCGIAEYLHMITVIEKVSYIPLSEKELKNQANDFLFHTVWAEKKVRRGELWTAIMCINGYLKSKLLSVIEMYEHIIHGETYDTRYGGRMIEQWSESFIAEKLKNCFAGYNSDDLLSALESTKQLYITLCRKCAQSYSYKTGIDEIDN